MVFQRRRWPGEHLAVLSTQCTVLNWNKAVAKVWALAVEEKGYFEDLTGLRSEPLRSRTSTGAGMANEHFAHGCDLNALTKVRPRGQCFEMQVTPSCRHYYENHEYETYTARFLGRVLNRCSLFIDIGANCGFYTLLAGTQHPDLEILALEPVPETFEALKRNLAAAGLRRVQLEQAVASDEDGATNDQVATAPADGGVSPPLATPALGQIQVKTVRLDTLLASKAPCPALVKVAVEGH